MALLEQMPQIRNEKDSFSVMAHRVVIACQSDNLHRRVAALHEGTPLVLHCSKAACM
jgi:hypothetical protein